MSLPSVEGLVRNARSQRDGHLTDEPLPSLSPDRETRRELAKLTATYYNGLAVAMFAVGGLAPLVSLISIEEAKTDWRIALFSIIFVASSLSAHAGARYSLRKEFEK